MNGIQFPITFDSLPSNITSHSVEELPDLMSKNIKIEKILTNHTGGCYAYKIMYKNKVVILN